MRVPGPFVAVVMVLGLAASTGLSVASAAAAVHPAPGDGRAAAWKVPAATRQLVVGVAPDWDSSDVVVQRFVRSGKGWTAVAPPVPGRLGAHGLAWGRGISPRPSSAATASTTSTTADPARIADKHEGDRRSPAGAFRLGRAFGYDPAWATLTKLDYVTVGTRDLFVEDPTSPLYNTWVRLDHEPTTPFERQQQMEQADPAHRLEVVIEHNTTPKPVPGKGSAILFHYWRNDGAAATAGCTSLPDDALESLVRWLDPSRHPVYVLLPAAEYAARRTSWGLPPAPVLG